MQKRERCARLRDHVLGQEPRVLRLARSLWRAGLAATGPLRRSRGILGRGHGQRCAQALQRTDWIAGGLLFVDPWLPACQGVYD
jgi:hypothetical protein